MVVIAQDKLMHYFVGSLIMALCIPFIGVYGLLVVLLAAVGKEAYDKFTGKGTPELMDIVYTMFGGLVIASSLLFSR